MRVGVVPELAVQGPGYVREDQAHLLLRGWKLGLQVPSCLLCLSSLLGTSGWSQALCYIYFSCVSHFSEVEDVDSLCPLPFVLRLIQCKKDFILFLKPESERLGLW